MKKTFALLLIFAVSFLFLEPIAAQGNNTYTIIREGDQLSFYYDGEETQTLPSEDKTNPYKTLASFFLCYLDYKASWEAYLPDCTNVTEAKDDLISSMEEDFQSLYGLVHTIAITIKPDSLELLPVSPRDRFEEALLTIQIYISHEGEEDSGEDQVLMLKDKKTGSWYVAELPL